METYGSVDAEEAAAALAAVRQSRARVAWSVAAVLVFVLFAGTGLTLSARAGRR